MKISKKLFILPILIIIFVNQIKSDQKESSDTIIFGQTIDESTSFKLYGNIIKNGILACFNNVNDTGGVNGKKLKLESMNDHGNPINSLNNTKAMLNKNIDIFIGNMGTRSILKLLPLIKNGKIAMLFPWGGNEILRDPNLKYIVNGPGLIQPQIEKIVSHINDLGFKNVSLFCADDAFSKQNADFTVENLKNYKIEATKIVTYNRYTMNIQDPADKLIENDPKIVICLATSQPTAKLISRFFEKGCFGTNFFGIDSTFFVEKILHQKGAHFLYTSFVPNPNDKSISIVNEYATAMGKYFPNETTNILSLTYYISAKILVEALKKISGQISKEKIIEQIEKMQNLDLGNFVVNFDSQTRHAYGKNISLIKG